jgi:hypothetical protein
LGKAASATLHINLRFFCVKDKIESAQGTHSREPTDEFLAGEDQLIHEDEQTAPDTGGIYRFVDCFP